MNVVADSNFFIALSSKNDDLHSKAEAFAKLIQKRKDRVYINDLIFSEIVTVISQRVNQELARQVGDRLLTQRNSIYTVPITDILLQKTWNIFIKYNIKMSALQIAHY